uniref:Galectin n=1 Tax=Syphacia muris TaxID=451379 RepID=A0A0N5AWM6_9BILA
MYASRWSDEDSVSCAKDGAGVRSESLNCYVFVNGEIDNELEVKGESLTGPGTVIKLYFNDINPKTLGKSRVWLRVIAGDKLLFGVGVKSNGQLVINDEYSAATSRYPNRKLEKFGGPFEIFIIIMNRFAKIFLNGKFITDFPFIHSPDDKSTVFLNSPVLPSSFMAGKIPLIVDGIGGAEEYCRNNFFGHVFTPKEKSERELVESEVFTTDSKFTLFVPLGINFTTQPRNFEGDHCSYVTDTMEEKFTASNDCVAWIRIFRRRSGSSWEIKDGMELYPCKEPLASFVCRSRLPKGFNPTKEVLPQIAVQSESGVGEKDIIVFMLAGIGILSGMVMIGAILFSGSIGKRKKSSYPRDSSLESPPIYDTPVFEYNDRDDFDSN